MSNLTKDLVTQEQADAYYVRSKDGFDYARIFILAGERKPGDCWGYISVVSSYGSFGHCFSHIGAQSIEGFLCGVGFDYLMGKFFGAEARLFDSDKTANSLRKQVLTERRAGDLDRDKARDLWTAIDDADGNYQTVEAFTHFLADEDHYFYEAFMNGGTEESPNPQCVGFWRDIWPQFIEALRAKCAKVAA